MRDDATRPGDLLDRLFAGGSTAMFLALMASVGEAIYLVVR